MSHPITPSMIRRFTAVIAKTRSGKTYTIKGAIEEALDAGDQVVVLDPTSAYYGLRLEADGKTPAYPELLIIGGEYGDVPLVPTAEAATALADVVFDQGISCVVDVGQLVGELVEWSTAFATQLYRRSNKSQPITFVIDEAHEFAPKDAKPGNAKNGKATAGDMAVAFRRIATGGGSRGIRLVALTQRVSKLHNDILSSCETIVAMKTIWPNDREVVVKIFSGADDKEKGAAVLASLAKLKTGEGWIWDTNAGTIERVVFPKIKTFDSSATPTGKGAQRVSLKKIDREKIGKLLADAAEKIRENDPEEMKRRIEELEEQLEEGRGGKITIADVAPASKAELEAEFERGRAAGEIAGLAAGKREGLLAGMNSLDQVSRGCVALHAEVLQITALAREAYESAKPAIDNGSHAESFANPDASRSFSNGKHEFGSKSTLVGTKKAEREAASFAAGAEIPPRQCRMVSAAAFLYDKLRRPPTRAQVGALQGVRFYTGTFGDDLGKLRTNGLVIYPSDGLVEPTRAGRDLAAKTISGTWSLRAGLEKLLDPRHRRMLDAIAKHRSGLSREQLGKELGVKHTTGTFGDDLGKMRTLELIDYPEKGFVKLNDWVRSCM